MNLLPTFLEKQGIDHYVPRSDENLLYHVEFRGQRDALSTYKQADNTFDEKEFDAYIGFLAHFLDHCKHLRPSMYGFSKADLTELGLTQISPRFANDILTCETLHTLDLTSNKLDGAAVRRVLQAATASPSIKILHIIQKENDEEWRDEVEEDLKAAIEKLDQFSFGTWVLGERRKEIIREHAMLHKTSLVYPNSRDHDFHNLEIVDLEVGFNSTAVFMPLNLSISNGVGHYPNNMNDDRVRNILQQGTGIQSIKVRDSISKHSSPMFWLLQLNTHTKIQTVEIRSVKRSLSDSHVSVITEFLRQHRDQIETLILSLRDEDVSSEQILEVCNAIQDLPKLSHLNAVDDLMAGNWNGAIGCLSHIDFAPKQKKKEDSEVRTIRLPKIVLPESCIPLFAERVHNLQETDEKYRILMTLDRNRNQDVVRRTISILETVNPSPHVVSLTLLPYDDPFTYLVLNKLSMEHKLNDIFAKFSNTILSEHSSEKEILLTTATFKFPMTNALKRDLLCHNLKLMPVETISISLEEVGNDYLEHVAQSLKGKPVRHIYMDLSNMRYEDIVSGVTAMFDVVKNSTAPDRGFILAHPLTHVWTGRLRSEPATTRTNGQETIVSW